MTIQNAFQERDVYECSQNNPKASNIHSLSIHKAVKEFYGEARLKKLALPGFDQPQSAKYSREMALMHSSRSPARAEGFWRSEARHNCEDISAWIMLKLLLVLNGRKNIERQDEFAFCTKVIKILSQDDTLFDEPYIRLLLSGVYNSATNAFLNGCQEDATEIFNITSTSDPLVRHLSAKTNVMGLKTEQLTTQKIKEYLEDQMSKWRNNEIGVPKLAQNHMPNVSEALKEHEGKKVLLLMRKHWTADKKSREQELRYYFFESAKAAGLNVQLIDIDPLVFVPAHTVEDQKEKLFEITEKILTWKPDVVLYDELCGSCLDDCRNNLDRFQLQSYKNFFESLKNIFDFTLIGLYFDSWKNSDLISMEYAATFADKLWYFHTPTERFQSNLLRSKSFCLPVPHITTFDWNTQKKEDAKIGSLGSISSANFFRSLWGTLAFQNEVPIEFISSTPWNKSTDCFTRDLAAYYETLSSLKMCVQFTGRSEVMKAEQFRPSEYVTITCGRTFESLLAKTLLLEEYSENTEHFLVPYVHFVPFRNISELKLLIEFFDTHPEYAEEIANQGHQWMAERFSPQQIWAQVFEHLNDS